MKIGIYIIYFLGCKRVYIGQSINIKNRLKYHRVQLKKGGHYNLKLQRAFNKYGASNMRIKVLENCNQDELNEKESHYISLYNAFKGGLNCSHGGDSFRGTISSKKVYQYCAKSGLLVGIHYGFKTTERSTGVGESNVRQCCYGQLKTAKGFHFSLTEKTPQTVLIDIISNIYSKEFKERHSKLFSGTNNPMYGKKRPDVSGDNNPYRKMIQSGYKPNRKIKIEVDEIITMYKSGKTQIEISKAAECTQPQISTILLQNGIRKFRRQAEADLYFSS